MPLPFRLDHVNVWLIDEDDGWTVIDAGCATEVGRAAWEALIRGPMKGGRIRRVIATHGHVDHVGLIGELVARHDSDFCATFGEWAWATDEPYPRRAGRDRHLARLSPAQRAGRGPDRGDDREPAGVHRPVGAAARLADAAARPGDGRHGRARLGNDRDRRACP
jgi:glyoxylase-like metal-dependent hydrolase (beta-lactamase superfamily II)